MTICCRTTLPAASTTNRDGVMSEHCPTGSHWPATCCSSCIYVQLVWWSVTTIFELRPFSMVTLAALLRAYEVLSSTSVTLPEVTGGIEPEPGLGEAVVDGTAWTVPGVPCTTTVVPELGFVPAGVPPVSVMPQATRRVGSSRPITSNTARLDTLNPRMTGTPFLPSWPDSGAVFSMRRTIKRVGSRPSSMLGCTWLLNFAPDVPERDPYGAFKLGLWNA